MQFLVLLGIIVSVLATPSTRITGGKDAAIGQFPYQVSVQFGSMGVFQHICGGSIITPEWIITAGQCITELPMEGDIQILAGIVELTDTGSNRQKIEVVERIVHPDYQGGANPNDIALLKLEIPLKYDDFVQPILLPEAGEAPIEVFAALSGWGSTSNTIFPEMPNHLQTADLPLISFRECEEALVNITGSSKPLEETNICTGPLTGGISACSGDSGGPLAQNGTVIGIVSWGIIPCGTIGAPSIFTQVSNFIDFINEHVAIK